MTRSLDHHGRVADARGDLSLALEIYQRSRMLIERLTPATLEETLILRQLGRLYRTGHPDQAAQFLTQAIDTLEAQVGRLGGSQDLQAGFIALPLVGRGLNPVVAKGAAAPPSRERFATHLQG